MTATDGRVTGSDAGREAAAALLRADARDAWVLARTETRAQVRRIAGDPRQVVAFAVVGLMFGLALPLMMIGQAVSLGGRIAGGAPAVGAVGVAMSGVLVTGLYLGGAAAIQQTRVGSIGPLVRTSVPPRALVLGRFTSESVQATAFGVPAAVLLLGGVAYGAGGPLVPLALLAASLPLLAASLLAGRVGGTLLKYVSKRVGVSLWVKALVYLVVIGAVMLGVQRVVPALVVESEESVAFSLPALLSGAPLQAYGELFLVPFGATPGPVSGVVAAVVLAAVPVGLAATLRLEQTLLLAEFGEHDAPAADETRTIPVPFAYTPSGRVAWRYLVRTTRDPRMLSHLVPFSFGALGMVGVVFEDPGILLTLGPHAATVLGGLLAGATYCLNPMGDDRDQLPLILTSTRSTATMLRGRALAGTALGFAVAAGLGVPLAVADGSPENLLLPLVFGPPFMLAAAGTALGMGSVVPKFERRDYMNIERAHPSMLLTFVYGFGGLVAGMIGVALIGLLVTDGPSLVLAGGLVAFALVVGAVGVVGYRYAVRKFDALTMDDV